jgi:urease accessory protein
MITVSRNIGNISDPVFSGMRTDLLMLEWFECSKRIFRKRTVSGVELAFRSLDAASPLSEGDVLHADSECLIVVGIIPCKVLVVQPRSPSEMAAVSYEIGNKHLPLFYEDGFLLVPFEMPLYKLLLAQGIPVEACEKKLLNRLNTSVAPHGAPGGQSLFSRIMGMKNDG